MNSQPKEVINTLETQGFLPLFHYHDKDLSIKIIELLYKSGVRIVEYVDRDDNGLEVFKEIITYKNAHYPDLFIGAGTIKTVDDAKIFIEAGADFISCPGIVAEIGEYVQSQGKLWMPGCMTITEVMQAEQAKAQIVKLIPASLLKSSYVVGLRKIFPNMGFVPMGGIDIDRTSLTPWFDAGVTAVCLGSRILGKVLLDNAAFKIIQERISKTLYLIRSLKNYKQDEDSELEQLNRFDF